MAAVPLDPVPFDSVAGDGVQQLLPQVGVLDRFLVRRPPAVALPTVDPARNPLTDVIAVGGEGDAAGLLERVEALDCGLQLHAVVGRQRLAPRQLALARACAN